MRPLRESLTIFERWHESCLKLPELILLRFVIFYFVLCLSCFEERVNFRFYVLADEI